MNSNHPVFLDKFRQKQTIAPWLPIGIIVAIAAIVFFYRIDDESFWIDELISLGDVRDGRGLPPRNLMRPLYYILLSVWVQFGTSDAWLRSLSVLFGLGAVVLLYWLGCRIAGKAEGAIAALLFALSPLVINHAQEVRMYVLSAFLCIAGSLALTYALERPQPRAIGAWILLRWLAMLAVPLNVTLTVADAALILWTYRKRPRTYIPFGVAFAVLGALWVPSLLTTLQEIDPDSRYAQSDHVANRRSPGVADLVRLFKFYTVWPFAVQSDAIAANFYKLFTLVLVALPGAALLQKHRDSRLFWPLAWFAIPIGEIFLFSQISLSLWVTRYLLFAAPFAFVLLAAGWTRLWRQWRIPAVAIAIAYLIAVGGGLHHYYTVDDRTDYRTFVETIETQEQPGDVVVWAIQHTRPRLPLDHYYQGSAEIVEREALIEDLDAAAIATWLDRLPPISSRLWIAANIIRDNREPLKTAVERQFNVREYRDLDNLQLFLVTPREDRATPSDDRLRSSAYGVPGEGF